MPSNGPRRTHGNKYLPSTSALLLYCLVLSVLVMEAAAQQDSFLQDRSILTYTFPAVVAVFFPGLDVSLRQQIRTESTQNIHLALLQGGRMCLE